MAKETAEQKLLKLIETTDATDSGADQGAAPASAGAEEAQKVLDSVKGSGAASPGVSNFFNNIINLFKGSSTLGQSPQAFGLKQINTILIVSVILTAVFFAQDFRKQMRSSRREILFPMQDQIEAVTEGVLPPMKDVAAYIERVARRNIFQPYEPVVEEVIAEPIPQQQIINQVQNLKLVGISWQTSEDSITAMIEDRNTSVTHFLTRGDVLGGVRVEKILVDGVVLSFEGETLTLDM